MFWCVDLYAPINAFVGDMLIEIYWRRNGSVEIEGAVASWNSLNVH